MAPHLGQLVTPSVVVDRFRSARSPGTRLELGTALETLTSAAVAARAAVHASTVVRTRHLLGFQSFEEARAAVRQQPGD